MYCIRTHWCVSEVCIGSTTIVVEVKASWRKGWAILLGFSFYFEEL